MRLPRRIGAETGRYSLIDGIPFELPVASHHSPALMAAFSIDADKAAELLPGRELHPLLLSQNRGLLMITVVDYTSINIGKYIEFSIAIFVTHGLRAAPPLLPLLFQKRYDIGQYVYDLPVSTEISVKGGKGIWGMPKHQANLDFRIDPRTVSSQYDLDGKLAMRITIRRPRWTGLPIRMSAANFCQFRGMLMKSDIYFHGPVGVNLPHAQPGSSLSATARARRLLARLAFPADRSSRPSFHRRQASSTTTTRVGSSVSTNRP